MRFLYSGIGFNLALLGLGAINLTAIASPATVPLDRSPSSNVALIEASGTTSDLTVIKGNGIEFTAPAGFKGGQPSSEDTKAIIASAAKLSPTMASFAKLVDRDPTFIRAMAVNTSKPERPEIVLITRLPIPATIPMSDIEVMMAKSLPSMLPESFKLVEHKVDTVGARQIVRLTVTANIQGALFRESIGLFREGNELFQVTYVYDEAITRQAQPTFEQMINTFKAVPGGSGSAIQG